ncbi:hypothetical protein Vadar_027407 [Vaccinium darrowii]|uniref:Uncharacterized protein n=1 Tax=Vaccinium darrowii TaxID=229202 RepID=A0ACB7Y1Z9_9ERIC|nr:hypothetical protein Vadar_027407 [Vaccinium darrowii]
MQEQRSKEAKNALATPLTSHMAIPSSFPHPGEPWPCDDRTLGSPGLDLRLKKVVQLVDVVAAMSWLHHKECVGAPRALYIHFARRQHNLASEL